jgi:hypothetical protein
MEDLNSIPGFEEIFNISHPEFAKMKALNQGPAPNSGGTPPKGGNSVKFLVALGGVLVLAGFCYICYVRFQQKKTKSGIDRP